jgi:hypothetical protein
LSWNFAFDAVEYIGSYRDGVGSLEYVLESEATRCPSEKIVLAGYSQGALAIHLALGNLAGSGILSHIGAVVLVADPAKRGGGAEFTSGTADPAADGIYTKVFGAAETPLIPGSQVGHTITYCHKYDIVCAPGLGASGAYHSNYYSNEDEELGVWAGERMFK